VYLARLAEASLEFRLSGENEWAPLALVGSCSVIELLA
jgi:hypothetical protein